MKKISIVLVIFASIIFVSCEKESTSNIIGCECNDGSILPSTTKNDCGEYTVTENVLLKDTRGNIIYPPTYVTVTTKKNRGGFKKFIYGQGTFCSNFPNSVFCLGRNY